MPLICRQVLPLLRGPVGSFVRLGFRKGSADQLFFVNIQVILFSGFFVTLEHSQPLSQRVLTNIAAAAPAALPAAFAAVPAAIQVSPVF